MNENATISESHVADVTGCDFGQECLATCSSDKTVRIFERYSDGQFVEKDCSPLVGHTYALTAVRFTPSGNLLCSASIDGTCIIWNIEVSVVKTLRENLAVDWNAENIISVKDPNRYVLRAKHCMHRIRLDRLVPKSQL